MDYFLARFFTVKNISTSRLRQLHSLESAVNLFSLKSAKKRRLQKITKLLWWQEGGLFLNKEFRSFWQADIDREELKKEILESFKQSKIEINFKRALSDINFMHECDLALNTNPSFKKNTS